MKGSARQLQNKLIKKPFVTLLSGDLKIFEFHYQNITIQML